jgi:uncharacterized protein (DUF2147 family)
VRVALASVAILTLPAAQNPPTPITGRWANPSRSVIIDVAACGSAYCGTVAWASAKAQRDARRGTDQLIGTQLLTNLQHKGAHWQGRLFVPDRNMRVNARLQLNGDQLKVSGCAAGRRLCRSQTWSRADGPLPAGG